MPLWPFVTKWSNEDGLLQLVAPIVFSFQRPQGSTRDEKKKSAWDRFNICLGTYLEEKILNIFLEKNSGSAWHLLKNIFLQISQLVINLGKFLI